ncbi:MAG: hypothetical protein AB9834_09720 [Lentimicrobium sp.]
MNTELTDHYIILKNLLPANYRMLIKNEIKVSLSLINKVLRGQTSDNKGIIVCAYRIAMESQDKKTRDEIELKLLKERILKNS